MNSGVRILTALCAIAMLAVTELPGLADEAEMADGAYLDEVNLMEWDYPSQQPKLGLPIPPGGQQPVPLMLFDPSNACRWVSAYRRPPVVKPDAFVEMNGGDILPGKVIGFRYGDESLLGQQPPCLLVRVDIPTGAPGVVDSRNIRVMVSDIRRLVCRQISGGNYTPKTLYYSDGRQLAYQQLRWTTSGVTLLLDEGRTVIVPFSDIGELHLPRRDSWQSYYLTLARLNSTTSNRLMRLEMDMGLVATVSLDSLRVVPTAQHMIQPSWSPDPIWIPHYQVRMRRFFTPCEVPLSRIEPSRVMQESPLGGVRRWRADYNTRLNPLRSGGRFWAWGLAVQAQNQLVFDLPPMSRSFRTRVGIDQEASHGGCARALIYANSAEGTPLWQSPQLIGASNTADSDVITLSGASGGQTSLVLVADMSHQDRPEGADPMNIRDFVDWLQPTLELDPQELASEIAKQLPQTIPAWQDWTVSAGTNGGLVMVRRWEDDKRFQVDTRSAGGRILLSRTVELPAEPTYLALGVVANGSPSIIDVRINGLPVACFQAPGRGERMDPEPRFVPLQKWAGQNATIEIEQFPTDDNSWVSWRGLALTTSIDCGTPLTITSARAVSTGTVISVETGGVVFAANSVTGQPPDFDTYTITAETAETDITGFRLELLTDPRLPNNGPGRLNGSVQLAEFKATIAPKGAGATEPVTFTDAASDSVYENYVARNVVAQPNGSCWWPHPGSATHAAVFATDRPVGFPGGSVITFALYNKPFAKHLIGKFRILTVTGPVPDPVQRPYVKVPLTDLGVKVFDENADFAGVLNSQGSGAAVVIDTTNSYSGSMSVRLGPGSRQNNSFLGQIKICENPGPDEARYIRFAWKKDGGQAIVLQLAHDGRLFGPVAGKASSFRYQAGPAPEYGKAAVIVDKNLPAEWTVVTRDLFADFGEFVLNGISFDVPDGTAGNLDDLRLGRTLRQLEAQH